MHLLSLIALLGVPSTIDVTDQVTFEAVSVTVHGGGANATGVIEDGFASLEVATSGPSTSVTASATAFYRIYWRPKTAGEAPPSQLIVGVHRRYSFSPVGGSCRLAKPSGEEIDFSEGSVQNALEYNTFTTVDLAPQPDGTVEGTAALPTNVVTCTQGASAAGTSAWEVVEPWDFYLSTNQPLLAQLAKASRRGQGATR